MRFEDTPYVRETLDGFGSVLKEPFAREVETLGRKFESAFEWCSGIGEIGMTLLRKGLCAHLTLSDINPEAIRLARQISARDGLDDKIGIFLGDNMAPIPPELKFDLVVGNPPNYFDVQKAHPYGKRFFHDLRPNDRGWKIHENFYATIRPYLMPGAVMLIHEVEPYKTEIHFPNPDGYQGPYDVRAEAPITSFERMTSKNGLKIESVTQMHEAFGVGFFALKIVAV